MQLEISNITLKIVSTLNCPKINTQKHFGCEFKIYTFYNVPMLFLVKLIFLNSRQCIR